MPKSNFLVVQLNIKGGASMLKLNGKQIVTQRFPNNETKVKDFEEYIERKENILELKYFNDEDLITLMFVKKRIDEAYARCALFVWYMPYSRMDRKIDGDLFTLKYICDFINWLRFTKVVIMEPHSVRTVQMLDRVRDIYPVTDWIKAEELPENVQIVFQDKAAACRYAHSKYKDVCIMEKRRDPITGKIEDMHIKEGKVLPGAKCIIIDDLCSQGGTFAWAGSILKDAGAAEVVLVVSHCEETIFKGTLLKENSPIDMVYTSTSIMDKEHPKIKYMDVDVASYMKKHIL